MAIEQITGDPPMNPETPARPAVAERIADAIAADMNDRRGLHLDTIDEDIQADIRTAWLKAINRELASSQPAPDAMNPFEAAVRNRHNGYNPVARDAMPTLTEPETPEQALDELIEEAREVAIAEAKLLAAPDARLREACEKFIDAHEPTTHAGKTWCVEATSMKEFRAALSASSGGAADAAQK